ncbi:MAG: hypothetical protein U0441_17450 [Polyangiaceae bacterium]
MNSRPANATRVPRVAWIFLAGGLVIASSCSEAGSSSSGGTGGSGGTTTSSAGNGGTTTSSGGTTTSSGGTTTSSGGTGGLPCAPSCAAVSGISSECVAIEDNGGAATIRLRMAHMQFTKPAAFTAAQNPVIAGILAKGVTMNLPDCNLNGSGTFSWLLELDPQMNSLKMGGAFPVADPTQGYCFVNTALGSTLVAPVAVDASLDVDGHLSVPVGGNVVVPLFLTSKDDYILLPFRSTKILEATLSADRNCIGAYDVAALDPASQCLPPAFIDGAKLDAFMTLEDADTVPISPLKKTLCALLTGEDDGDPTMRHCKRDASSVITSKGDWCSATDAPATMACADAYKVSGDFAASAVEITGDCP